MKNFDKFILQEKELIIPKIDFIKEKLNKNKNKILKLKTLEEADDLFNELFNKNWIIFNIANEKTDACINVDWAIFGGVTYPTRQSEIGSVVEILLGKEFIKKLKKNGKEYWDIFVKAFESIIGHEFIHVFQVQHIPMKSHEKIFKDENKDKENYIKLTDKEKIEYISRTHEIYAFAFQAVKEFMMYGYTPEEVIERIKKPFDETIKPENDLSGAFYQYITILKPNDRVLGRFLKMMYNYCMLFIKK